MSDWSEGVFDPGLFEGLDPETLSFLRDNFPEIYAQMPPELMIPPQEIPDPSEANPRIGESPSPYEGDPRADNPLFQGGEGGTGMRFYMPGGSIPGGSSSGGSSTVRNGGTSGGSSGGGMSSLLSALSSGDFGKVLAALAPLLLGVGGAVYGSQQRDKATQQTVEGIRKSSEEMKGLLMPQAAKYDPYVAGGQQAYGKLLNAPPSNLSARYTPLYRLSSLNGK